MMSAKTSSPLKLKHNEDAIKVVTSLGKNDS